MVENFDDHIIRVRDLTVKLNENLILNHLDLDVRRGEILGFVGASGAGKSVLTRTIIGLIPKMAGTIEVFGVDMGKANPNEPVQSYHPVVVMSDVDEFTYANIGHVSDIHINSRWQLLGKSYDFLGMKPEADAAWARGGGRPAG